MLIYRAVYAYMYVPVDRSLGIRFIRADSFDFEESPSRVSQVEESVQSSRVSRVVEEPSSPTAKLQHKPRASNHVDNFLDASSRSTSCWPASLLSITTSSKAKMMLNKSKLSTRSGALPLGSITEDGLFADGDNYHDDSQHGDEVKVNDTYEFDQASCEITTDRLTRACQRYPSISGSCQLNKEELAALLQEQNHVVNEDGHLCREELKLKARSAEKKRRDILNLRAEMIKAMARSRFDRSEDGVLGVQPTGYVANSLRVPAGALPLASASALKNDSDDYTYDSGGEAKESDSDVDAHDTLYNRQKNRVHILVKNKCFDPTHVDYVRKPDVVKIAQEQAQRSTYTLRQVVLSRRFHLYKYRFANAQFRRTLLYPTLPQPDDIFHGSVPGYICGECTNPDESGSSEKQRTRPNGHRFILAADTQFGIVMDGYAMDNPSWGKEIELSRRAVAKINAMEGNERPLFVCVCGDLVDTESSFSRALASWKKVMSGWERNLVFEQQVKDFKRIWSALDPDIALVCLCGNHDVGNRPTRESITHWTSSFGDDFFAFWANGSFNISLNNCLFSDPSGAPDLFREQLIWLEKKLAYAKANNATHIFVYGHFPWFLKHEHETDEEITTFSSAPEGWGPAGTRFPDGYFTIPKEERQMAMILFKRYGVTACFSGHFHQNVIAQTSWGMPMIVTGPLSMTLRSEVSDELSKGEPFGCGMRIVDVGAEGQFEHTFVPLDEDEEFNF